MTKELASYLRGWKGYFGFCETPSVLENLDQWIRRRLRSVIWKQWKRGKVRFAKLCALGVSKDLAAKTAGSAHGPWRIANSPPCTMRSPSPTSTRLEFQGCSLVHSSIRPNRRMRTRMSGGVGGEER
jgi:RNA-directed DNA polymerase